MRLEVAVGKVADVDGSGPVLGVLVGRGATDSKEGVCACSIVSLWVAITVPLFDVMDSTNL